MYSLIVFCNARDSNATCGIRILGKAEKKLNFIFKIKKFYAKSFILNLQAAFVM
jgi:hypothetical protein